jgi:hypothetical protein
MYVLVRKTENPNAGPAQAKRLYVAGVQNVPVHTALNAILKDLVFMQRALKPFPIVCISPNHHPEATRLGDVSTVNATASINAGPDLKDEFGVANPVFEIAEEALTA